MTNKINKVQELNATIKELNNQRQQLINDGIINELIKPLFDNLPDIKMVAWTQYTPYFNDGDPCEFHVGEVYVSADEDEIPIYENYLVESDESGWITPQRIALYLDPIQNFINENEDIMESIYDNHTVVIFSRDGDGIKQWSGEYDHD